MPVPAGFSSSLRPVDFFPKAFQNYLLKNLCGVSLTSRALAQLGWGWHFVCLVCLWFFRAPGSNVSLVRLRDEILAWGRGGPSQNCREELQSSRIRVRSWKSLVLSPWVSSHQIWPEACQGEMTDTAAHLRILSTSKASADFPCWIISYTNKQQNSGTNN